MDTWLVLVKLDLVRVVFELTEGGDIEWIAFDLKNFGLRLFRVVNLGRPHALL